MSIGENIKIYRKKKGLTQKELAEKLNKNDRTIQKYERGDIIPPVEVIIKIGEILDVSTTLLIKDLKSPNVEEIKSQSIDAMYNEIQNTVDVNPEKKIEYNMKMKYIYDKYFFELINWKTSSMTPHDFFKFVLSLSLFNETTDLDESDIEELSILFYRLVQLKAAERYMFNEGFKKFPDANFDNKKYEESTFLTLKKLHYKK